MTEGLHARKSDELISRVLSLWPLWLTLAGGIVTAINFYNKVNDLVADQRAWKGNIEQRRAETQKDLESIRTRIALNERDIEWIKGIKEACQ